MRSTQLVVEHTGFEVREMQAELEAGKDKEKDFPLELPERMQPCQQFPLFQ